MVRCVDLLGLQLEFKMIKFSELTQSFYDDQLNYESLPEDVVDVTHEQHIYLLSKLNTGHYVFSNLQCSTQRPSSYHKLNGKKWVDQRSDDQIKADKLKQLSPISRYQFKLALLEKNWLKKLETAIDGIEDEILRARVQIEYSEVDKIRIDSRATIKMLELLNLDEDQVIEFWEFAQIQ